MMVKVLMVVICWMPNGKEIKEAWRYESTTTMGVCRQMTDIFNQGGKAAVMTVRCTEIKE